MELKKFFRTMADLWKKGVTESDEEVLRRSVRLAGQVYEMLGSAGWEGLRIKLGERMEAQLKLILQDSKLGRVTDADLRQRMTPVLAVVELVETIDQTLIDGQRDSVKLEQLAVKRLNQEKEFTNEELATSAT